MHRYSTKVEWSEPDGAFIATCPEFPGVSTFGEDLETAVRELQTAVDLALETYEAEGWDPPQPDFMKRYSGQFRLRLPESMHRELVRLADHEGVSLNTISVQLLEHGLSCRAKILRYPGGTAQREGGNTDYRSGSGSALEDEFASCLRDQTEWLGQRAETVEYKLAVGN